MLPIVFATSLTNSAILLSINLASYLKKLRETEEFENSYFYKGVGDSMINEGESVLNDRTTYFSSGNLLPNVVTLISTIALFAPIIAVSAAYSLPLNYELATIPALLTLLGTSCYGCYRFTNGIDILPKCIGSEKVEDRIIYNPNSAIAESYIGESVYR